MLFSLNREFVGILGNRSGAALDIVKGMTPSFPETPVKGSRMQNNARKQARAIAIAKAEDENIRKLGFIALAITMVAACAYGLAVLVL